MEKPWSEDFDFYFGRLGDEPMGVFVDLGVAAHLPLAEHNVRIRLLIQMQAPRPDGMRAPDESERLFQLEDQLVESLAARFDAIMLGRVTVGGMMDVVLYGPGTVMGQIEGVREVVDGVRDDYHIDIDIAPDISWEFYREVLWPDAQEYQFIMSNRVLRQLEQLDDDLTRPRPVDHVVFLPSSEAAQGAVEKLRGLGFVTTEPEPQEGEGFRLAFSDKMAPVADAIHERVRAILSIVLPLQGIYDGWGCPLAKHLAD